MPWHGLPLIEAEPAGGVIRTLTTLAKEARELHAKGTESPTATEIHAAVREGTRA